MSVNLTFSLADDVMEHCRTEPILAFWQIIVSCYEVSVTYLISHKSLNYI